MFRPPGFELEKTDDQGLSVSKFDPDSEANVVDSERTWLVHFRGAPIEPRGAQDVQVRQRPRSTAPR